MAIIGKNNLTFRSVFGRAMCHATGKGVKLQPQSFKLVIFESREVREILKTFVRMWSSVGQNRGLQEGRLRYVKITQVHL